MSRQLSGSEAKLEEMRQRVKVMDDALKANALSTNALENAKKNLEAKVKMYEDKLPHLENSLVSWDCMSAYFFTLDSLFSVVEFAWRGGGTMWASFLSRDWRDSRLCGALSWAVIGHTADYAGSFLSCGWSHSGLCGQFPELWFLRQWIMRAICKSALRSRQIAMPAPTTQYFTGRMPFLPPNQQHQSSEGYKKQHCSDVIITRHCGNQRSTAFNWDQTPVRKSWPWLTQWRMCRPYMAT